MLPPPLQGFVTLAASYLGAALSRASWWVQANTPVLSSGVLWEHHVGFPGQAWDPKYNTVFCVETKNSQLGLRVLLISGAQTQSTVLGPCASQPGVTFLLGS